MIRALLQLILVVIAQTSFAKGIEPRPYEIRVNADGFTRVNPLESLGSCQQEQWSDSNRLLLCGPDTYKTICSSMPKSLREAAEQDEMKLRKLLLRLDGPSRNKEGIYEYIEKAVKKLGPSASQRVIFDLARKLWERDVEAIDSENHPKVKENVNKALVAFKSFIAETDTLSAESKTVILASLDKCAKNLKIDITKQENAWIEHDLPFDLFRGLVAEDGLTMGPLSEGTACTLTMTLGAWLSCGKGDVSCFLSLFHEFGHLLNGCHYKKFGNYLQVEREYLTRTMRSSRPLGTRESDVRSKMEQTTEKMSRELFSATSCLAVISAPHDAIPDSCEDTKELSQVESQHCGMHSIAGYPSQWSEAEADSWGASVFSRWLEKNYATPVQRRKTMLQAIGRECVIEQSFEKLKSGYIKKIDNDLTDFPLAQQWIAALRHEKPSCLDKPAFGDLSQTPWIDKHQQEAIRINRNYLRNSDLRDVLGCPIDPNIPVTCAPGRSIRFLIPQ